MNVNYNFLCAVVDIILERRQQAALSKDWRIGPKRLEEVITVPLPRISVEPR